MSKKNKKNSKGLTLIELLAVVVILLAISVMAITSISSAIERNKEKQNKAKQEVLVSYAKLYYDSHKNSLKDATEIKLRVLQEEFDLTDDDLDDANGNPLDGCIIITNKNNTKVFEYNTENCTQ